VNAPDPCPSAASLPAASFPLTQRTLEAGCSSDSEEDGRTAVARVGPQLQARLAVQAKQVVRLEGVVLDQAQRITQVGEGKRQHLPTCLPACLRSHQFASRLACLPHRLPALPALPCVQLEAELQVMKQLLLGGTPLGAARRGGGMGLEVGGGAAGLTPASTTSQSQFYYDAESGGCTISCVVFINASRVERCMWSRLLMECG
jgi:hypothetical protein